MDSLYNRAVKTLQKKNTRYGDQPGDRNTQVQLDDQLQQELAEDGESALTVDLQTISVRAPVAGKNIKRTLEENANLAVTKFETYQDDPMFHQLSLKFDLPGYSGLMCTFLQKSSNGRFELFPDPNPPSPINKQAVVSDSKFEKFFSQKSRIYGQMRNKTLCPMLEQYRGHFQDQSLYFQGTRSMLPGERAVRPFSLSQAAELKTGDRVLEGLEQSALSHADFDQTSLIEEFENAPSLADAEQIADPLDVFDDYQVENFSERKRLQLELLDSQTQSAGGTQLSRVTPLTASDSVSLRMDLENNLFSREFEYWACLEPEKWRFKTRRIKSSRKRLRTRRKKQLMEEQFLQHFQLVFGQTEPLESKNVIHIMKQALVIQIECDDIDLGRVDPIIPIHPNSDLSNLLSHPILCFQANQSLKQDRPAPAEVPAGVSPASDPISDDASAQMVEELGFSDQIGDDQVLHKLAGETFEDGPSRYPLIKIPSENTLDISKVTSKNSSTKTSFSTQNAKKSQN